MLRIERLRADHEEALLAFERDNRAYFARSVPDRGDAFFADYPARHRALLAEQDTGACRFHVVLDAAGELIGRVNLVDLADGAADLGYRIGERSAGRGTATAAVREVCRLAATEYGLGVLTASAALDNPASAAVLRRTGFTVTGETVLNDNPGLTYRRTLTPEG
ncbi:GNAT family N-acetyltransferase [Streptomyces sp. NPDC051563]|uniref:GNAT family N-acetyltransferase n=1 Tax=Streptomyces sp. NPDC051563 TaxID=3365659 RepID=UPI0037892FD6